MLDKTAVTCHAIMVQSPYAMAAPCSTTGRTQATYPAAAWINSLDNIPAALNPKSPDNSCENLPGRLVLQVATAMLPGVCQKQQLVHARRQRATQQHSSGADSCAAMQHLLQLLRTTQQAMHRLTCSYVACYAHPCVCLMTAAAGAVA